MNDNRLDFMQILLIVNVVSMFFMGWQIDKIWKAVKHMVY
jgi:hypothetical protein